MLKKTFISILLTALLVALSSGLAQATIVTIDDIVFSGPPGSYDADLSSLPTVVGLLECVEGFGPIEVQISGTANSSFGINKAVKNETGMTWTAFELTLDAGSEAVFKNPSSETYLTTADITDDGKKLTFSGDLPVKDTETVTMIFDIEIPSGVFSFSMTQTGVPEPATIALLGLGSLVLIRRKRRA